MRRHHPTGLIRALAGLLALALLAASCASDTPGADPDDRADPSTEDASGDDPDDPPETAEPDGAEGGPDDADPPASEPEDADPQSADAPPVPALLDFTAPGLDGGQVVGAELAGQAVALWFWAPW